MNTSTKIQYGANQTLALELAEGALVARGGTPTGQPLSKVADAVAAALAAPVDYPPFAEATLSSDRVCLAIDRDVPQVANVVVGVLQPLFDAGVPPNQVTVVLPEEYPQAELKSVTSQLSDELQNAIQVRRHDSRDGNGLAYLASTADGEPIQINREICDADVVIPVSCIRAQDPDGDWGERGSVFPTFADAATREKYVTPWAALSSADRAKRTRGREEAAWLLGARLTVQLVSGGGDEVLHVVAGDVDSVGRQSRELAMAAWDLKVPQRANLVIATIDGGEDQQNWENVSRAITAALRVVQSDDAAIAICSEVAEMPGPTMIRALIGHEDFEEEELPSSAVTESMAGQQLRDTLQQMPVFFLSKLAEDVVLDLGLAHVEKATELNNLCRKFDSCIVLSNAQHVLPTVANEEAAKSV